MDDKHTYESSEDEKKESTATNARRNIYFNKENLDLYYFLQQKGYKGTEFACRAIRKLMEEEMNEIEFEELENPSNSTVLRRMRVLEERQISREQKMVSEITEKINQSLIKEISALKDMIRSIQMQLNTGVVMSQPLGHLVQENETKPPVENEVGLAVNPELAFMLSGFGGI